MPSPSHVMRGGLLRKLDCLDVARLHYHLKHGQLIFITWTPSISGVSCINSTILGFNLSLDSSVFINKL